MKAYLSNLIRHAQRSPLKLGYSIASNKEAPRQRRFSCLELDTHAVSNVSWAGVYSLLWVSSLTGATRRAWLANHVV